MKTVRIGYEMLQIEASDEKYMIGESPLEITFKRERTESIIYTETYKVTANNLVEAMHKINIGDCESSEEETGDDEDFSDYSIEELTEVESEEKEDASPLPGQIDLFGGVVE